MKKLYLLVDDSVKNGDNIKNCSIDIKKLYTNNTFIESTIENCDLCIYFLDDPLPDNFSIILEKLYNKKIVFIFCGDRCCNFNRTIINLTNNICTLGHTIFEDLNLLKLPTFGNSYRDFLVFKKTNSYHQNLKNMNVNKINTLFNPIKIESLNNNIKNLKNREYDICLLGTSQYDINTMAGKYITENKEKVLKIIENLKNKYKVITGKLGYEDYINTLKNSKIVISSQGWGEFSYKDYEALFYGCVVIKNCDYKIKSCPNIYDNIVYCDIEYDNLIEKINNILQNIENYHNLVDNGRMKLLNINEDKQIDKISESFMDSYNKYKINHIKYDDIHIYKQELLNSYDIQNNNLVFHLINNIDKKVFNSFGFLPITDYYIYHAYKCFQNKRFKCSINFRSNQDEIRYYDGNNWNKLISENKTFEINYENDFSKYTKTRIGFCFKNDMKKIEIKELDYKIDIL